MCKDTSRATPNFHIPTSWPPHIHPTMTKIDQNSRQNFILRGRFPRESCRSRRDLQFSLGNLGMRMKFCLEIWLIFGSELPWYSDYTTANPDPSQIQRSTKTLDKTSSSGVSPQGKVVDLAKIYNFPLGTYP